MKNINSRVISRCFSFSVPAQLVKNQHKIGLLGICEDRNGSYLHGPRFAPEFIREHFHSNAINTFSELGMNVKDHVIDFGDVYSESPTHDSLYAVVQPKISQMFENSLVPIALGGDHSISYSVVKSIQSKLSSKMTIIHFDAHPDIYENFEENPNSHASQFARILEDASLQCNLISIGIRTLTDHQRRQYSKYGVHCIEARHFPTRGTDLGPLLRPLIPSDSHPIYISCDIDVLDPAFAPGVSHRESGGLSPRQLIDAIHSLPGQVVGADLVELNPLRDIGVGGEGQTRGELGSKERKEREERFRSLLQPSLHSSDSGLELGGLTASVSAKVLKEMGGRILSQFK